MITISLCMIVRNEEHAIGRCLDSVCDLVDEINIVDTGSADQTKAVVSRYTDRIFDFPWIHDFAAARNFSFDQATRDFILWLDADDVLLDKDREAFRRLKETLPPDTDAVLMNYVLTRDPHGRAQSMTRRHRLVRRDRGFRWRYPIHEFLVVSGPRIVRSNVEVTHVPDAGKKNPGRNLELLRRAIAREGEAAPARYAFYLANELMAAGQEAEAEERFLQFLEGEPDNYEDHIAACGALAQLNYSRGDRNGELQYLLRSFAYDVPRADFCSRIAAWFQEAGQYARAIFWYQLALQLGEPESHYGLMNQASWTWAPHVQLAICYGKLGRLEQAYDHNEAALAYFPGDAALLDNRRKLEAALAIAAGGEKGGAPDAHEHHHPDA